MKKGKKLLLTTVLTMLFTLFLGISVSAATADEPVVPPLVKKGDFLEADGFVRDYQLKAGEGTLSIPIQITKTGTLTLGIMNKSEDAGIMEVLSSSADADNSNALITGGKLTPGKNIIHQDVLEKVSPRYIHIVRTDTEHMDQDITVRIVAIQELTDVIKASQVRLSKTSVTYNGKAQKPWFTVKTGDGLTLDNEYDTFDDYFTVKYSNNKNVGQATVTITFKEGYGGTVKKTFTILPKGTTLSKVTGSKKGFTVKWKKQASQTTGYEIQYSTSSKFKGAKTVGNIKAKTTSKSITKLKAGKKYYVRIRTYKTAKVGGKNKKLYSGWSKAKTVTTKK